MSLDSGAVRSTTSHGSGRQGRVRSARTVIPPVLPSTGQRADGTATMSGVSSATVRAPISAIVRRTSALEHRQDAVDALLAGGPERVQVGPAGHAGPGAEGDRLDDVAPPPHPAVADHLEAIADRVDDRCDEVDRRRRRVELAAAVVRQGDRLDAVLGGEHGVGDALDALDDHRAVPDRPHPLDVAPRQVGVELRAGVGGHEARRVAAVPDPVPGHVGEHDRLRPDERPRPAGMDGAVEQRAEPELGRHREAAPHVPVAMTEHGGVDGEHDRLVAGVGGAGDQLLHQAAVAPRVDLEPLAARR